MQSPSGLESSRAACECYIVSAHGADAEAHSYIPSQQCCSSPAMAWLLLTSLHTPAQVPHLLMHNYSSAFFLYPLMLLKGPATASRVEGMWFLNFLLSSMVFSPVVLRRGH